MEAINTPEAMLAAANRRAVIAEDERDKFMWQVRDSTVRAERAEFLLALVMQCADTSSAPVIGGGWQPIETAPTDGTPILLAFDDMSVEKGRWGTHLGATGWVIARLDLGGPVFLETHATHWMPLPDPPVQS